MNVRSTAVVLFAVVLFAVTSHGEYYCGEMNSWGATAMSQDAFGDTWNVTITADGADSVSEFKFDQDGAAPLDWGVFAAATKNATIGYLASTGGSISFVELDTNCYTFRMNPAHTQYVIMETSTDPVTIAGIDDDSDERYTNAVSVFISLSGAPSAAEAVWVCYTTNAWATRQFVAATGSASSCTALIPAQTADTMVEYYVLTSTMPQPVLESNYDLCTLKGDNNGGTNYAYTCPATCYWRDGAANNKWHNTSTWPWRYGIFRRWVPANYSILRVDNNNQAGDWDQNKTGLIVHRLYFGSGASSARTITGQTLTFAGIFCLDPFIQNESTAAHVRFIANDIDGDVQHVRGR